MAKANDLFLDDTGTNKVPSAKPQDRLALTQTLVFENTRQQLLFANC
jgi:hypothetical protein